MYSNQIKSKIDMKKVKIDEKEEYKALQIITVENLMHKMQELDTRFSFTNKWHLRGI